MLAGRYYHDRNGVDLVRAAIATVNHRIDSLRLPGGHDDWPEDMIRDQFAKHWSYFGGPLVRLANSYNPDSRETQTKLADIWDRLSGQSDTRCILRNYQN